LSVFGHSIKELDRKIKQENGDAIKGSESEENMYMRWWKTGQG
jgi:hypothetical protein